MKIQLILSCMQQLLNPICYKEIEAIEKKNGNWELIDLLKGAKTIGAMWIYKTELNEK